MSDRYPAECPHIIERTPMRMQWLDLTMLHWRYPAEEVQALLPEGLTVETFDGSAWVGLVPFEMRVDIPFAPPMKSILHFPETNVRTYVYGASGEPGVFFWSLEASSLPAVITARTTYQVPYFWSDMSIQRTSGLGTSGLDTSGAGAAVHGRPGAGDIVRYEATRKWPGPAGATSTVEVEIGDPFTDAELTGDLDRFLTARWALYGSFSRWLSYATMFHEPWPLHHATARECDDQLVTAAGLSAPTGDPLVHYAPEVNVRCGWPGKA